MSHLYDSTLSKIHDPRFNMHWLHHFVGACDVLIYEMPMHMKS
jgi:hypothetical protein